MAQRRNGKIEEQVPFSKSLDPVQGTLQLDQDHACEKDEQEPLSVEDRYRAEKNQAKLKHWKESPFAVGMVEPTWADEVTNNAHGMMCCPAFVCSRLGAGRVGNMAVLRQTTEWVEQVELDEETGEEKKQRFTRPRLLCILGPYWPMLLMVTYPLILGVSLWTLKTAIPGKHFLLQLVWAILTIALILALAFTSCRDPGILYRMEQPPPQDESLWRWNDQAMTFRPRGAFYDTDCAVVVEEFDHTCPWTGTAIGKRNMLAFQCFVGLVFICLIINIMLLTGFFG